MAIAFDAAAQGNAYPSATLTYSHTVGSGSNMVLFVAVVANDGHPTSVTYNNVGMTNITGANNFQTQSRYSSLWYLVAPATGANDVKITCAVSTAISGCSASYSGCSQSTQGDATGTNAAGPTTSFSTTLTTATNNSWTVSSIGLNQYSNVSAGTGSAVRAYITGAPGVLAMAICDSNSAITPAGSYTMNYSDGNGYWVGSMSTILPYVAVGPTNLKTWNNLAKASIKTINNLAIGSTKSINGLT